MRLRWPFGRDKYETRRDFALGALIIEEAALRDVVQRFWGRVRGVTLRNTRFADEEKGLRVEITLRAKEKPAPAAVEEKNAAVRRVIETCCVLPVDAVCVRVEEPKRHEKQ
jgi:hypothetical protein